LNRNTVSAHQRRYQRIGIVGPQSARDAHRTSSPALFENEPVASLGQTLKLPGAYDNRQREIERMLPELA
jgi:hypothetical protein